MAKMTEQKLRIENRFREFWNERDNDGMLVCCQSMSLINDGDAQRIYRQMQKPRGNSDPELKPLTLEE